MCIFILNFLLCQLYPQTIFFYNKDCCWCYWNIWSIMFWFVITKRQHTFIFLVLIKIKISLKKKIHNFQILTHKKCPVFPLWKVTKVQLKRCVGCGSSPALYLLPSLQPSIQWLRIAKRKLIRKWHHWSERKQNVVKTVFLESVFFFFLW